MRSEMRAALIFAIAGVTALSAGAPATPVRLSPAAAAAALKEIEKDRADTQKWLESDPTSYLAAIDRRDFAGQDTLTVGRAADNDVRLDDSAVTAHHVRVTVRGDVFQVQAMDPDARFGAGGKQVRDAKLGPSAIQVGRFNLRLSHQGFPALIVFDPRSPHFKSYKGLTYFPVDLSYRYELPLTLSPRAEVVNIQSTHSTERHARRVGWFEFTVGGTPCRLEAVRLLEPGVGKNDIGIFFRDATTGHETYSVGRYLDAKKLENGKYLLDFNLAYNPACAISKYYNCPIPSKENTLTVAIRAGEMDAHYQ